MSWEAIRKAGKYFLTGIVPQWGEDYRGVAGEHDYRQVVGYESRQEGLMSDANMGLDSNGMPYFGPDQHPYNPLGYDQMRQVQNSAYVKQLFNEEMWTEQEDDFDFSIAYPSGSELQPGTDISDEGWLTDGGH